METRSTAWPRRRLMGASLGAVLGVVAPGLVAQAGAPEPASLPIVVALDPGHGGTNLGASGSLTGVYEKNVTLALAERVRALLEDAPEAGAPASRFRVVLCRTSDRLVAIRARARCAEQSGARLFLSLHTNAVPAGVAPGSQRGFEVFVLGPREIEDDAALAALRAPDDVEAVWQSHVVRASGERALALAHAVDEALAGALGPEARRGVKQSGAALDVLRGAGTPAALVEIGFLDHPEEGARLASPSGREPIAQALASAIRTFALAPTATASSPAHLHARLQARADGTGEPPPASGPATR